MSDQNKPDYNNPKHARAFLKQCVKQGRLYFAPGVNMSSLSDEDAVRLAKKYSNIADWNIVNFTQDSIH